MTDYTPLEKEINHLMNKQETGPLTQSEKAELFELQEQWYQGEKSQNQWLHNPAN